MEGMSSAEKFQVMSNCFKMDMTLISLLSFDLLGGTQLTLALAPVSAEHLRYYSSCSHVVKENAKHCFS